MNFLKFFITVIVFFTIFNWIINKTDFYKRLFSKHRKSKHYRGILIFILFVFTILLDFAKELLKTKYGFPNCLSSIISGFIIALYINFCKSYVKEIIHNDGK